MTVTVDFSNTKPIRVDIGSMGGRVIDIETLPGRTGPKGNRGPQGPGVGEGIASIASSRGMWPLRKALATGTARVIAMGDSKTEGTGLTSVTERWLNQLQGILRARYAPAGDQGLGYLPADYFTFYGFPTETTRSATGWQSVGNGGGLGNRSIHLTAGGWVEWPAMTFTAGVPLIVHWTRIPAGASMEVLVDGVVASTIVTAGADRSMSTTVTVAAGSHVIRVRHKAGSGDAVRIEGVVHRTKTTGVIVYDAARSGGKVSDYSDGMVADGAPTSDDRHWEAVSLAAPHAIVMAFGANDMSSHTAQEWRDDLIIAVAKAKAAAPGVGVILLVGAQGTGDVNTDPGKILEFEAAARDAVGADPDVTILYESALWAPTAGVDYAVGDPSGWLAPGDTVHTGPAAHAQIARYLAAQITGADAATDALGLVSDAVAPAVAAAQSAQADAAQSAEEVTLALQAQFLTQDEGVASLVTDPVAGEQTRAALVAPSSPVVGKGDLILNVRDYGLKGNNATESLADLKVKLQEVASSGGRAAVYFPPGDYAMSEPLPNIDYVRYFSDGGVPSNKRIFPYSNRTRLKWVSGSMLTPDRTLYGLSFENLAIQCGNLDADPVGYLIDMDAVATGPSPAGFAFLDFTRCWIDIVANSGGFIRGGVAVANTVNDLFDVWIDRCRIERRANVVGPAVHIKARNGGTNHINFRGGWHHSRGNINSPFLIIEGTSPTQPIGDIVFDSVIGEQNNGGWIHLGSPHGATISHCKEWDAVGNYTDDIFKVYQATGGAPPRGLHFRNSGSAQPDTYDVGKYLLRVTGGSDHDIGYVASGTKATISLPTWGLTRADNGGRARSLRTTAVAYTITTADDVVLTTQTAAITVELPGAGDVKVGRTFTVKNNGTGDVTVDPIGSTRIDGNLTAILTPGQKITVISTGGNWFSV